MMVKLEFGWAADVESSAQYVPRCVGLVVCVGTMMAAVNAHGASDSKNVGGARTRGLCWPYISNMRLYTASKGVCCIGHSYSTQQGEHWLLGLVA